MYLGQVLVMGTHNGLSLLVTRFAKEKLESLSMINWSFSLQNFGEGSHLTKRFIAS